MATFLFSGSCTYVKLIDGQWSTWFQNLITTCQSLLPSIRLPITGNLDKTCTDEAQQTEGANAAAQPRNTHRYDSNNNNLVLVARGNGTANGHACSPITSILYNMDAS
jgi:hypothetical protein